MRPLHLRASASRLCTPAQRRGISDGRRFAESDHVLLRNSKDRDAPPILRLLKSGRKIETHRGTILHDDIIGKRVRDIVQANVTSRAKRGATDYRLHEVTLEEYCRLTRRLVTPVYPTDANLIVSLLDLHSEVGGDAADNAARLEILEAGTGHGSLTLHLSRAIHAANSFSTYCIQEGEGADVVDDRNAVIHTIDISPKFSTHAIEIVRGFRRGMYARNVDFHVGDVSQWLEQHRISRLSDASFLSHAILDLPGADSHLASVADALRVDGTLIAFAPSITQIIECATKIKNDQIPLDLDHVIELGVSGGSGGREWDVRFVRPRSIQRADAIGKGPSLGSETMIDSPECSVVGPASMSSNEEVEEASWSMVCRPKVGERIVGGGFLGVWKKLRETSAISETHVSNSAD